MFTQNPKNLVLITLFTFLIIFVLGLTFLIVMGNNNFSIFINSIHHISTDFFFKYITYLGDGVTAFSLSIICFFYRKNYGLSLLFSLILTTAIAQLLKRVIFIDIFRPSSVFDDLIKAGNWNLVEGVHLYDKYSFPSGHTATIFCVCIFLAFLMKSKWITIFLVLLASVVGFSRIYLSQHFLADVLFGSFIGTIISSLVYIYVLPFLTNIINKGQKKSDIND